MEKEEKKKKLIALKAIPVMDVSEVPDIFSRRDTHNRRERIEWAYSKITDTHPLSPIGIVEITRSGINNSLYKGFNKYKASLYPVLDKLIENSVFLYENKDSNGSRQYILGSKFIRTGHIGYVGIIVKEDSRGNKYYSHTIYQKNNRTAKGVPEKQGLTLKLHPATYNILHEILSVNVEESDSAVNEKDYLNQVAKEHFGIPYLFPYQRLAISNVLDCAADPAENNPAQIVILPTGAGKSLCFMLPALLTQGITLIIFPLLSLMADQKRRLDSAGIPSLILRGGLSKEEKAEALSRIKNGEVKIVIANPEILLAPGVIDQVKQGNIFHMVIDEAHTVSQWGDTFRNEYLELGKIVKELKPKVTTAFTATASKEILERFAEIIFGGIQPNIIRADPDRPNIRYDALPYLAKDAALLEAVQKAVKPLIVFCSSRDGVEITARRLKKHLKNQDVWFYHAGLTREEKKKIEDKFFASADGVLVATCAYGMGVDKSNIRTVLHADLPSSAEAYLQESGRGGRDRKQAYAVALVPFAPAPESDPESPDSRRRAELYRIFTGPECRRKALLHILEHDSQLCTGCDVCDKKAQKPAGLSAILNLVHSRNRCLTVQKAVSILKGNLSPDTIQKRLYLSKSWGLLSGWEEKEIGQAIEMITRGNFIKITYDKKLCINREKWVELRDIM